jgi:hypothetical protein
MLMATHVSRVVRITPRQVLPGFVGTKLTKVAVAVGKADYPHHFPEFFAYLLALSRVCSHPLEEDPPPG